MMIGLWVPVTLAAAGLQTLRTAQQKHLTGVIGQNGAHFARYFYGAPLAAALLLALGLSGRSIPLPGTGFALYGILGSLAQIIATGCLIHAFTLRNFTVATVFSKTETIQAALLSLIVLGEGLSGGGWLAIAVGFAGLVLLTTRRGDGLASLAVAFRAPATVYGLASGFFFALSSVGVRSAALALPEGDALIRAATTLAATTAFQTLVMGTWLVLADRKALAGALGRARRPAATVGIMSVVGSFGWFLAMTLEPVAHVRALAQIEIVFTIAMTVLVFHERPSPRDYAGVGLIVASVLILLLAR
ncbi:DMT family transporter [Zavarzinia compransoris]|uniref:DMT family transporter n=1 Tax=Zavarzinia marina TaxID=2911065 RepID=UPI001F29D1E3|nr:DMT family transporter [Zavarzinia marina]MCF4165962.1 DMT family transporter [Zavarzinia marina]